MTPSPLGTAPHVLLDATDEIGTTENPAGSNRTKYGRAFGLDGYAWCAMFVWFILVVLNKLDHIKSAYTPAVFEWYRAQGRTSKKPMVGALVFFNFPDSLDRIQHIGFVDRVDDDYIWTIEGNTSSGTVGSQDDGGIVAPRKRPRDASIVGYAYPHYLPSPTEPVYDFPVKAWFGKGDTGADVRNWQRDLNGYFKARGFLKPLEVDGHFDVATVQATKQFQHEQHLDVDGRVGQHTIRKLETIRDRQRKREDR
jgi:hypothetical protein